MALSSLRRMMDCCLLEPNHWLKPCKVFLFFSVCFHRCCPLTLIKRRIRHKIYMMTSSNQNIFCIIGLLCREFAGHPWIPLTGACGAELWCFSLIATWINGGVNRYASDLICHHAHYDVTVIYLNICKTHMSRPGIFLAMVCTLSAITCKWMSLYKCLDGLLQAFGISSASAMEMLWSCTETSIQIQWVPL